jgi:hypothetical protein
MIETTHRMAGELLSDLHGDYTVTPEGKKVYTSGRGMLRQQEAAREKSQSEKRADALRERADDD